jgi:hypothetical protein
MVHAPDSFAAARTRALARKPWRDAESAPVRRALLGEDTDLALDPALFARGADAVSTARKLLKRRPNRTTSPEE